MGDVALMFFENGVYAGTLKGNFLDKQVTKDYLFVGRSDQIATCREVVVIVK